MFAATAMYHDWSGAEKDSVTVVQYSPSITGYHPTLIYLSGPGHLLHHSHQHINPSSLYQGWRKGEVELPSKLCVPLNFAPLFPALLGVIISLMLSKLGKRRL